MTEPMPTTGETDYFLLVRNGDPLERATQAELMAWYNRHNSSLQELTRLTSERAMELEAMRREDDNWPATAARLVSDGWQEVLANSQSRKSQPVERSMEAT